MDNQVFQQVRQLIDKNDAIGIAVGKDPSLDEMAAALGLFLSLRALGKNPVIASPTEPLVEISSLVGIDQVKKQFGDNSSGDLIVSFPYREGEIEKVSYTLEDNFINIVVKAGEQGLSFSEKNVAYKRSSGGSVPTLLFVVGTPTLSALGNLFDPKSLKDTTVINIDNKPANQGFGDIVLVSPKMSSVSEQVADLLEAIGMSIEQDIAQNLFSGIMYATKNFQDPKTSSMALEMGGILMRKGAVRKQQPASVANPQQFIPMQQMPVGQSKPQQRFPQQRPQQNQNRPAQMPRAQFNQQILRQMNQTLGSVPVNPASTQSRPFDNTQGKPVQNQNQNQQSFSAAQDKQGQTVPEDLIENNTATPPDDWLMPKVYKGSTNV